MPTGAKTIAAVIFAVLGYIMAQAYRPLLPEGTQFTTVPFICAGIGLVCGWLISGALAGRGYGKSIGLGIRTAITTVFWALLGFSIYTMVIDSTKGRYSGSIMEAVMGVFDLILESGQLMLEQNFLMTMLIGGAVGGILTEFAGRRWS